MPSRPRHPKPDANQADIVRDLRACGVVVFDQSRYAGAWDILCYGLDQRLGIRLWQPFEIKVRGSGRLTATQRAFMVEHPGAILVVETAEDVLRAFGRIE